MKIYTSYFNNLNNIPSNIIPISICLKPPLVYCNIINIKELAPTKDILYQYKMNKNKYIYTNRFKTEILDKLNAYGIYIKLQRLTNNNDCVLLCYEDKTKFCHRHLVAEWLSKSLDITVEEL